MIHEHRKQPTTVRKGGGCLLYFFSSFSSYISVHKWWWPKIGANDEQTKATDKLRKKRARVCGVVLLQRLQQHRRQIQLFQRQQQQQLFARIDLSTATSISRPRPRPLLPPSNIIVAQTAATSSCCYCAPFLFLLYNTTRFCLFHHVRVFFFFFPHDHHQSHIAILFHALLLTREWTRVQCRNHFVFLESPLFLSYLIELLQHSSPRSQSDAAAHLMAQTNRTNRLLLLSSAVFSRNHDHRL